MNNLFWIVIIIMTTIQLLIAIYFTNLEYAKEYGIFRKYKINFSIMLYVFVFIILSIFNYLNLVELSWLNFMNKYIDYFVKVFN